MRAVIIIAAFALTGCNEQPLSETANQAEAENGCPATASGVWESLRLEASAFGADCDEAQATITIRNNAGEALWSQIHPAGQNFTLAGAESVEDMQRRLNEWINPPGAARDSTGDLPEWPANADSPADGEFPFYVEEGVDRRTYEALRQRDAPMFCYTQGMESLACLALEEGRLTKIGVQSFPG